MYCRSTAVAQQGEGVISSCLHVEVSLGKTLNPGLLHWRRTGRCISNCRSQAQIKKRLRQEGCKKPMPNQILSSPIWVPYSNLTIFIQKIYDNYFKYSSAFFFLQERSGLNTNNCAATFQHYISCWGFFFFQCKLLITARKQSSVVW